MLLPRRASKASLFSRQLRAFVLWFFGYCFATAPDESGSARVGDLGAILRPQQPTGSDKARKPTSLRHVTFWKDLGLSWAPFGRIFRVLLRLSRLLIVFFMSWRAPGLIFEASGKFPEHLRHFPGIRCGHFRGVSKKSSGHCGPDS